MNSPSALPVRRLLAPVSVAAIALTLLFTAQDAMRRGPAGPRGSWSHSLAINAIDWFGWALLVPAIVVIGRRHRLDDASHRVPNVAVWIAMAAAACSIQSLAMGYLLLRLHLMPGVPPIAATPPLYLVLRNWLVATAGFNFIIFAMISGAIHAALYYHDARARQLRESDLETRLTRAELNVLRMQLQPHFFFNSLHTVSSLMVTDIPTAQRVIAALGDIMRASIDHTAQQEVSLRSELAFVDRYVEIQKARFRNRLTVDTDVASDTLDALVPSLVLQPLVENAIRHGIEPNTTGGTIRIRAARENGTLTLSVQDDGSANAAGSATEPSKPGVGLTNIEARLAQLYGEAQSFRAARLESGQFAVTLTLPYHTQIQG